MSQSLWLNAGKIRKKKFFLTKMVFFTIFLINFDHKLQDPFLNKSQGLFIQSAFHGLCLLPIQFVRHKASIFWNDIFIYNNEGGSMTPTASKMGFFVTLVNDRKPLSNVTKSFTQMLWGLQICLGTMYKSNLDEQFPVLHVLYYFQAKNVEQKFRTLNWFVQKNRYWRQPWLH